MDFIAVEKSVLEQDVAQLIVATFNLEEISAKDIAPDQALFNEGLGLDSIDVLESVLVITKRYGCKLRLDDEGMQRSFHHLERLVNMLRKIAWPETVWLNQQTFPVRSLLRSLAR